MGKSYCSFNVIGNCFRTVAATEGLGALYVSLPTTLLMNLPYGCIMVAVNESARKILNPSGDYKTSTNLIAGAIAGASAAVLTNPLDLIKTKLQTQNLEPSHIMEQQPCPQANQPVASMLNNRSFTTLTAAAKPSVEFPDSRVRYTGATQVAINIYREVCNQKTNNSFRKFLRKNQIQCPYCRVVHDKVLPYLCLPCVKRIKYVNSPNSLEYLNGVCSHKLKNNTLCSKPCHENGLCNRHFNKNKKTELYENYLNGIEPITNYEKLPVDILKQLLKQKNIKGISKLNKTQLIKRLLEST